MYTKDKDIRITLRLNGEQFGFVKGTADVLGISPSEFLRMVINATLTASKTNPATAEWIRSNDVSAVQNEMRKEGNRRENEASHLDHQL